MTQSEDAEWLPGAVQSAESCIDAILHEFLTHPYMHRVEHSLHVDLYQALRRQPLLERLVPIGETGFSTRLVHKEWPSAQRHSMRGSRARRQSYDLAVLDPDEVSSGTLLALTQGTFTAPIAIELGLDYSLKHVEGDLEKLERNDVAHAYVVHLSRKRTRDASAVEESVLQAHRVRTAFAHLDPERRIVRWKGLADTEMREDHYGR